MYPTSGRARLHILRYLDSDFDQACCGVLDGDMGYLSIYLCTLRILCLVSVRVCARVCVFGDN